MSAQNNMRYFWGRKSILRLVLLVYSVGMSMGFAQGVGINSSGTIPHPSAMLDVESTTKGFVLPRMTTAQRDSIQNPVVGLQIFNLSTYCFEAFYGTTWQRIHCGCATGPTQLTYLDPGPSVYCAGQPIVSNTATTQGGTPITFSVSPALPAGLSLHPATGTISGTPAASVSPLPYTLAASNACGQTSTVLSIEVLPVLIQPIIQGPASPTVSSTATYSVNSVPGGSVYVWSVPSGWSVLSGQGTAAIQVQVGPASGNISCGITNSCGTYPIATKAVTGWQPISATGGTISQYVGNGTNGAMGITYRVHQFTAVGSGAFVVSQAGTDGQVSYLIVAGGGAGGRGLSCGHEAGGGGAGGVWQGNATLNATTYPIQVGSGGIDANGGNSSFNGLVALGGGKGGNGCEPGSAGGSGGGGSHDRTLGGSGANGQGFAGAQSQQCCSGGGGGGAAEAGDTDGPASGGDGISSSITGTPQFYGGGGAAYHAATSTLGIPGQGGGGASSNTYSLSVGSGQPNTGGGGGGGFHNSNGSGGSGGSGVVIIRYPLSNPNP
jgi:hypothetical protein